MSPQAREGAEGDSRNPPTLTSQDHASTTPLLLALHSASPSGEKANPPLPPLGWATTWLQASEGPPGAYSPSTGAAITPLSVAES